VKETRSEPSGQDEQPAGGAQASPDGHLVGMARGGSLNLVGAICNQVALFAITALIALVLGRRDVGRYGECYAMLSLLGLLSLCGFRSALTRFVAMHLVDDDAQRLRGTVRLGVGLSIVSSAVLGLVLVLAADPISGIFHDDGLITGIRLVGLTLPAATISDAALATTQGWRTQRPFTFIGRIYEPVVRLVLSCVALALGWGLDGAFWALVIGAWSAALLALRAMQVRLRTVEPARPVYDLRAIFGFSMISWVSTLSATGLIWADTLLLGAITTAQQVGVYNVATRLVTLAVFVMAPINASFAPHIAHLHHLGEREELSRTYGAATSWIIRLSVPAFVALLVFPKDLLHLFGPGFVAGASCTAILAVGQLVNAATGPCGTLLNMSGRVMVNMVDTVVSLVLNIGLNLWLIPSHGIVGAAIAWSVSLASVNIARIIQVQLLMGVTPFGSGILRALAAGGPTLIAAWLVLVLVDDWRLRIVVGIVAILVAYAASVLALGLTDDDRLVLRMLRRGGRRGGRGAAAAPTG
jgi:O-antigen/teichoic acid export membrane protein